MQLEKKLFLAGGALFGLSVFGGFIGFYPILKFGVRDQTALRKRNEVRDIYLKLPFPLTFSVSFFNVTNPLEVQDGGKPILKEVGPFVYDEFKSKVDVIDNDAEDSLTYSPYDIFIYNKNKSGGLDDGQLVTILNPLIVGMVNLVAKESPALLSVVGKAIKPLFNDPSTVFMTVRVKDILFDGIPIYCNGKDFSAKAVCTQMKQKVPDLLKPGPEKDVLLLSLLGSRNATIGKRFKILKGIKKSRDLGRLVSVDDVTELTLWNTPECNRYHGTDGWIFPPLLKEEEGIWSYQTDLCRSIQAVFIEDIKYRGLKLRKYYATLGDQEHNVEDKCYCSKTCLKKGVFDLNKCMGVPLLATLPHFYGADESFLQQVDGLTPNQSQHIIDIYFEPLTGSPIIANKRLQFNLPVVPVQKVPLMANLPTVLHPVFWVQESVLVEGPLFTKISIIFILIKVVEVARWLGVLGAVGIMGYSGYTIYNKRNEDIVKPLKSASTDKTRTESAQSLNKDTDDDLDDRKNYINHAMSDLNLNKY